MYLQPARVNHTLGFFLTDLVLFHKIIGDNSCHIIRKVGVCGLLFLEARSEYVDNGYFCAFSFIRGYVSLISHQIQYEVAPFLRYIVRVEAGSFRLFFGGFRIACVVILFLSFLLFHGVERVVVDFLYLLVAFRIFGDQRVAVRCLRQSCKRRALCKAQLIYFLREVCPCCCAHAVVSIAQIDRVKVCLKDLILAHIVLEAPGDIHLGKLSVYASLALYLSKICVTGKLLCDRRRTADGSGSAGEL